ncbi:MAG TPA: 3-oxoacyl-ACP reductase [Candidatus Luteococcus avicola]|nr:3-oxoacyl-ACP reductase [Candidatus Luteococcus avicola]
MANPNSKPKKSLLETIYHTAPGHALAKKAGLADPPKLRRGREMPGGPVALGVVADGVRVAEALADLAIATTEPLLDVADQRSTNADGRVQAPAYHARLGALVIDATGVRTIAQLEGLRAMLRPAMKGLARSGRVVLVADAADAVEGLEAKAVAQAIDGINRTVGKELRGGSTSNLLRLGTGVDSDDLRSALLFCLQGRSAFVDGQTIELSHRKAGDELGEGYRNDQPLAGRVVVVTGSARGIGAAISRTMARDGAKVVCVDMPQTGDMLAKVANEIEGTALQLDITSEGAGRAIADHVVARHGADERVWAIVHNAGITRDKMLANLDDAKWAQVLEVNLAAQMRMNEVLLDPSVPGGLSEQARIVGIASTSGVAGNKGQTNYAASKAGVMGLVRAMRDELSGRPVTVNAVAPGFIETDMTAAIPFVQREIFRRTNSLGQGGQPVDVAETIAWLCDPANGAVDGQVVRVCGQNLVGA